MCHPILLHWLTQTLEKAKKGLLFRPKDACFTGEIKSMISIYGKVAQEERKRKMRRTKENAGKYALVNNQEAAGKELLKKRKLGYAGKIFFDIEKIEGHDGKCRRNEDESFAPLRSFSLCQGWNKLRWGQLRINFGDLEIVTLADSREGMPGDGFGHLSNCLSMLPHPVHQSY